MYHKPTKETPKPAKPPKKWELYLRDIISGRLLLKTWKSWIGWLVVIALIAIIGISNEQSIQGKEKHIKELQHQHDSLILELKAVNEVVVTEESTERSKAYEEGYVDVRENNYYVIPKVQ